MQHQITPGDDDRRAQGLVFLYVTEIYPGLAQYGDMVRELTSGSEDYKERDRIERAVTELIGVGLLHRHGDLIIPTRACLRAYEVLDG